MRAQNPMNNTSHKIILFTWMLFHQSVKTIPLIQN
jgi:hypothetical protein